MHVVSGEAVLSACERACGLIDMRAHKGVHPCMGAVDLIPIYPLGEEVGVEDCAKEARGEMLFVHVCDAWVQLWILTVSVDWVDPWCPFSHSGVALLRSRLQVWRLNLGNLTHLYHLTASWLIRNWKDNREWTSGGTSGHISRKNNNFLADVPVW